MFLVLVMAVGTRESRLVATQIIYSPLSCLFAFVDSLILFRCFGWLCQDTREVTPSMINASRVFEEHHPLRAVHFIIYLDLLSAQR